MADPKPKVVLITGAAKRIGKTLAQSLHARGMNVIIHYRTAKAEASKLCASMNQLRQDSAITACADLTQSSALPGLIDQAAHAWGYLDVLINNASAFYPTPIEPHQLDMPSGNLSSWETAWDDLLNTNLKAPFFLAKSAAPWLKRQQGCIINITDIHAQQPLKHYAIYSISKAGLNMATYALARELAPDIRVNGIAPGAVIWPEGENSLKGEIKEEILSRIPLHRKGDPLEIAKAALFFIEAADYVTGQILAVDGGRLLNC